jgi:hypothetical protein
MYMSQKSQLCLYLFVSSNWVVINHQKGEIVSAIKPIVGFGVDDPRIRELMRFIKMTSRVMEGGCGTGRRRP